MHMARPLQSPWHCLCMRQAAPAPVTPPAVSAKQGAAASPASLVLVPLLPPLQPELLEGRPELLPRGLVVGERQQRPGRRRVLGVLQTSGRRYSPGCFEGWSRINSQHWAEAWRHQPHQLPCRAGLPQPWRPRGDGWSSAAVTSILSQPSSASGTSNTRIPACCAFFLGPLAAGTSTLAE